MDRTGVVEEAFRARIRAGDLPSASGAECALSKPELLSLFKTQCRSRALDLTARELQKAGLGFYTIGSSGHEGMAGVAHASHPDDPAFLHYRDGAFQIARAALVAGQDPVRDMLRSFACATDDPISGGRHKVLGSKALEIPPQTSTIASHLPKAVGAAYGIGIARRHPPEHRIWKDDAVVIASFGDASLNHSTAQGALNAAGWTTRKGMPLPILFVCEDNGIGISVKAPKGWTEAVLRARPGLQYFAADGLCLADTHATARSALSFVRSRRMPAVLHLRTVRLFGHAGADTPTSYLPLAEVEADEANDPLLHTVRLLAETGAADPLEALQIYETVREEVTEAAREAENWTRLRTSGEVASAIVPPPRQCARTTQPPKPERDAAFGNELRQMDKPQALGRHISWALTDLMLEHRDIVLMGEDVGRKGGVYGATRGLFERFGPARVTDTLLDEQSILGLGIGMAHNGFIPVPEIQFLAYLHNAEDQLRGEAATLPFFSQGQYTNPMVIRIAGLGYQKGFGGHFHNDNSIAVLRDIPGLIIACPSRPSDAAAMLRECVRLAREEQRVVVFLEPIALYGQRDLGDGDGAWAELYPAPDRVCPLGSLGITGEGRDLAIVSYGNGHRLSCLVARDIPGSRVIDLRWLAPLPEDALREATRDCAHVLIVDECRRTGGQAEALMALFAEDGVIAHRLTADDTFIATGPAHAASLPSVDSIRKAASRLLE